MIRVSFCLLAGALAPQLSSFPIRSDQVAAGLVLLVLLLPAIRRSDVIWLLLGAAFFCAHVRLVADGRLSPAYAPDSMLVVVRIADFPQTRGSMTSFTASAVEDRRVPERIRLSWHDPPVRLELGDVWQLQVKLRRPRANANPGTPDYEAWHTRRRIGATGYVVDGALTELVDSRTAEGTDRLRLKVLARIDRYVEQRDQAAVIAAILVGTRHRLTDEQWHRYARTGTSHLMAISGLHVGLAAVGAFYAARILLGVLGVGANQRRVALVASLLVATMYAAISGFAVPSQRAVVMLLIAGSTLLLRRNPDAVRGLAAAALLVLLYDPLATMAPGFWLSFGAVAVLFWYAQQARRPTGGRSGQPLSALRKLVVAQFWLFVGLMPLTAAIFDRIALSAPLVNLVAVPLFSTVTVPAALLSLVCDGPLDPIGGRLLAVAAASVGFIEFLIAAAASEPQASRTVPALAGTGLVCLLLPAAWIALPRGWPVRSAACVGAAALLTLRPDGPPPGCADTTVLDVGQGLAVVVRAGTHTLLYDTGPAFRGSGSAANRVVLPYLASVGTSRIEKLIVSHGDSDHAGGFGDIIAALPVGDRLSGEPHAVSGARRCDDGIGWYWGQTRFTILHPQRGGHRTGNDASCVLLIETGEQRILLTGDIEAPAEGALVQRRILPRVDAVTVPHHGSRTSSTGPFVRSLAPDYAIVSAAHRNRWDFPKPDVVARWRALGTTMLDTAASGAIRIRQCDTRARIEIERYRPSTRHVWHDDGRNAEF